jgi:Ferritin-like domain
MKSKNFSPPAPSKTQTLPPAKDEVHSHQAGVVGRRSFLRKMGIVGVSLAPATALLLKEGKALGKEFRRGLTQGDVAILRFLAAAEILETDLWQQYNEFGGVQDSEVPGGSGNAAYTAALENLDSDMAQYVHDNTDDEISHGTFLNAFLASKAAPTVNFDQFRTLPSSTAKGARQIGRLTNLTQLNVDTSFWARYRTDNKNPDLDPNFPFPQAVEIKNRTAIPRSDADTDGSTFDNNGNLVATDHLKAIAFTAGFHFAFIEQAGTSLYATLSQKVTNLEVLRILLGIGGSEIMHFQTWQDKAGNATPVTDKDPVTGAAVTFIDLKTNQPESLQANLIMPEPTPFLSRKFPPCAVIRPIGPGQIDAVGAITGLINDGLFIGQPREFTRLLLEMAADADEARRDF